MSAPDDPKVPTHSIDDERAVLGALLANNGMLDLVGDILSEADFYGPRNGRIFAAIERLVASGGIADMLTVRDAIATGDEEKDAEATRFLVDVMPDYALSGKRIRAYASTIRKLAVRRALVIAADECLEAALTQPDFDTAIDFITSRFGAIERGQTAAAPRSIAEIAMERIAYYEAVERGEIVPGWRTHIPALDARLNGGLRAGGLYILAARPSVGKSSLAQSIGLAFAADGLPTLFCSMEMAEAEVADRGVSNLGRVSYGNLLTGQMSKDDWNRAADGMEALARLPFHVDDQPGLTLHKIRAKAKAVKGLKVLIVDYLQLCASTRRDGNRNSDIEEVSRGLKGLAKELGIAVIALSQLNRDVEKRANKRPALSDLRDSGAIEQDADVVMFLWPVREFEGEGRRILGLGIDKNRQGRLGEIGLDFYGDTQRWEQSTADIRQEKAARSAMGGDL